MVTSERMEIEKKISDLKFMLSENSLQLLPEYESRISVSFVFFIWMHDMYCSRLLPFLLNRY